MLILLFLLVTACNSQAEFLDFGTTSNSPPPPKERHAFLAPNEVYISKLPPLLHGSTEGVYVSVGAERGFIGASISSKNSHLLLIDIDPNVTFYNKVNTALLSLAQTGNRQDYWKLRMTATNDEWLSAIGFRSPPETVKEILSNPETWRWWEKNVRDVGTKEEPTWWRYVYDSSWRTPSDQGAFQDTIYWYNDNLFLRIQALAKDGKIQAHTLDLNDSQKVQELTEKMKTSDLNVSVLDLSNVWQKEYMKRRIVKELISKFGIIAHPQSVLLLTDQDSFIPGFFTLGRHLRSHGPPQWPFVFRAYTFRYIREKGGVPFRSFGSFYKSRNKLVEIKKGFCSFLFELFR